MCRGPPPCDLQTPQLPLGEDNSRGPSSMPTPSVPPVRAGVSLQAPGCVATAEVGQLSPRERRGFQRKSSGGGVTQEIPHLLDSGSAPPCSRRRPPRRRPPSTLWSLRCSPAQARRWSLAQPGREPRPGESRASSYGLTAQSRVETRQPGRDGTDTGGGGSPTDVLTGPLPRIPSHDPETHRH